MTLVPESMWHLTDRARGQLDSIGITLSQLLRLLEKPDVSMPTGNHGEKRMNGFGLSVVVAGDEIRQVAIDGADKFNWQEWSRERAQFGDGDVAGADAQAQLYIRSQSGRATRPAGEMPDQRRRRRRRDEDQPAISTAHVLDRVHPALREEITRQVAGDFSRLVIESRVKVTVLPPKK